MSIIGFKEPFDDVKFGPFTGNITLMRFLLPTLKSHILIFTYICYFASRWFQKLNEKFHVNGKATFFYKPVGANKTFGTTSTIAKERLQYLLHSKEISFIYHCYNHYCCPIGYEKEPLDRESIYNSNDTNTNANDESAQYIDWIFLADTSRKYAGIHSVKWQDIDADLNTKSPNFINIRHLERGVQTRGTESNAQQATLLRERNLHCIIQFKKINSTDIIADVDQSNIIFTEHLSSAQEGESASSEQLAQEQQQQLQQQQQILNENELTEENFSDEDE
jgi:hypothetical protein